MPARVGSFWTPGFPLPYIRSSPSRTDCCVEMRRSGCQSPTRARVGTLDPGLSRGQARSPILRLRVWSRSQPCPSGGRRPHSSRSPRSVLPGGVPDPLPRNDLDGHPGAALHLGIVRLEHVRFLSSRVGPGRDTREEPQGPGDLRPAASEGRLLLVQSQLVRRAGAPPHRPKESAASGGPSRLQGLLQPGGTGAVRGRRIQGGGRTWRTASASC